MTREIATVTGAMVDPWAPAREVLSIVDIAHSLGHLCRYGGHVRRFYSVAEHCVLMSRAVAPEHRAWALMHDAAEAYLGDMTSPVKRGLERFQVAETAWLMEIAAWRGLTWPMPAAIKDADAAILADEIRELTTPRAAVLAALGPGLGVEIQCWSPGLAAASFFERFSELTWPRRTA